MTKTCRKRIARLRKHYIMMGGTHGCLPDQSGVYGTRKDAVESAKDMYELSNRQIRELSRTDSVELKSNQGAEYCEILPCDCSTPWVHDDSMDRKEEWFNNHPEWLKNFPGRLEWTETSSAFEITDNLTRETRGMSDGVDMFSDDNGHSIRVGTKRFYRAMNRLMRDQETLDAYFG